MTVPGPQQAAAGQLDTERTIVKPVAIVALGATAARSLLGRAVTISKVRGQILHLMTGPPRS